MLIAIKLQKARKNQLKLLPPQKSLQEKMVFTYPQNRKIQMIQTCQDQTSKESIGLPTCHLEIYSKVKYCERGGIINANYTCKVIIQVDFPYNKVIGLQITCWFFGCSASRFKEQSIHMCHMLVSWCWLWRSSVAW